MKRILKSESKSLSVKYRNSNNSYTSSTTAMSQKHLQNKRVNELTDDDAALTGCLESAVRPVVKNVENVENVKLKIKNQQ
jgi:Ulp1 family protease